MRAAQNQLVIKTTVGSAQPVAAALDGQDWEEAIGTIAGDDTILMVCADKKGANRLAARIQEMLACVATDAAEITVMTGKLKTAILGATGYSGFELARLLLRHPQRRNSGDASAFRRDHDGESRRHVSRHFRKRRLSRCSRFPGLSCSDRKLICCF